MNVSDWQVLDRQQLRKTGSDLAQDSILADHLARIQHDASGSSWSPESWEQTLGGKGVNVSMAIEIDTNSPIGFVCYRQMFDEFEIYYIATVRKFRRRGVARLLLEKCIEFLTSNKTGSIRLEVAADNDAALNLYLKCGFSEYSRRKNYYYRSPDQRCDAIEMQYCLTSN